jgi:hypothetical protein
MTIRAENPYLPVISPVRIEWMKGAPPRQRPHLLRSRGPRLYRVAESRPIDVSGTYTSGGTIDFAPAVGRTIDAYA